MPDFTIEGNPGAVRSRAATMRTKGELFSHTGDALARVTTDGWTSRAATMFREKFDAEPGRWHDAGGDWQRAAAALDTWADALEDAQRRADWARGEYARGEQATHDARAAYDADVARARAEAASKEAAGVTVNLTILPFEDPGEPVRQGALDEYAAAKAALDTAAHSCAAGIRAGCAHAPEKRNWLEKAGGAVAGFFQGAGEALLDLGKLAAFLAMPEVVIPMMLISDLTNGLTAEEIAAKYRLKAEDAVSIAKFAAENPLEFGKTLGKAILDWDTWADDPARAAGHLLPDAIIAVLTAGSGTLATRGAKAMTDGLEALRAVGRLDDLADLRRLDSVGDFRRLADLRHDPADVGAWDGGAKFPGKSLTAEQNAAAEDFLAGARNAEPRITTQLQRIEDATGAHLEGLDFRLKGGDSFKSKFADELINQKGDVDAALGSMKDSVRYTFIAHDASYGDKITEVRHAMNEAGFEETKFKNFWGGDGYQGVNAFYKPPGGDGTIEVQFHTPESFQAKMDTHDLYDELKKADVDPETRVHINAQMDDRFAQVPRPSGADSLTPAHPDPLLNWKHGLVGAGAAHSGISLDRMGDAP